MGARGAFIALSPEQYETLVAAPSRRAFRERYDTIQRSLPLDRLGYMDKAWWGLLCVLPKGLLDTDRVASLGKVSEFGSQRIYVYAIADWYLSLLSPTRVRAIASVWQTLDMETLKRAYFALGKPIPRPKGLRGLFHSRYHWYAEHVSQQDWEYVSDYCRGAQEFFDKTCRESLAALFEGSG